ncbi:MAG: hypothetical protein ACRENO_07670 [Thermodesulfobacteriota bacterium]
MSIKSVLQEELNNSQRIKIRFEKELNNLPKGSLIKKRINENIYYYKVFREGKKVNFEYMGKKLSDKEIDEWEEIKIKRSKLRKNISVLKKQIKFLNGALRGKEEI